MISEFLVLIEVFVYIPKTKRTGFKSHLQIRSRHAINLGWSPGHYAYKLWDLQSRSEFTAPPNYCVTNESTFPFREKRHWSAEMRKHPSDHVYPGISDSDEYKDLEIIESDDDVIVIDDDEEIVLPLQDRARSSKNSASSGQNRPALLKSTAIPALPLQEDSQSSSAFLQMPNDGGVDVNMSEQLLNEELEDDHDRFNIDHDEIKENDPDSRATQQTVRRSKRAKTQTIKGLESLANSPVHKGKALVAELLSALGSNQVKKHNSASSSADPPKFSNNEDFNEVMQYANQHFINEVPVWTWKRTRFGKDETHKISKNLLKLSALLAESATLDAKEISTSAYFDFEVDKSLPAPANRGTLMRDPRYEQVKKTFLQAEKLEISGHQVNGTWSFVSPEKLPLGAKVLGTLWAYSFKYSSSGEIKAARSRLTARGDQQIELVHYLETYAPVMNSKTFKILLTIYASDESYKFRHWDIKQAFVSAPIDKEIYIRQPSGFVDPERPKHLLKLNKALYGMKQASRAFYFHLRRILQDFGLTPLRSDQATYRMVKGKHTLIVATHVDDIFPLSNSISLLDQLYYYVRKKLVISDLGDIVCSLKMNIFKVDNQIKISMTPYINEVLSRFGMSNLSSRPTPGCVDEPFTTDTPEFSKEELDSIKNFPFRELAGCLWWPTYMCRPDLLYHLHEVSRKLNSPTPLVKKKLIHLCRYLKGTTEFGLVFIPEINQDFPLEAWVDSNWGSCLLTRKSRSGALIYFWNCLFCWMSEMQSAIALSTAESEFYGIVMVAKTVIWARQLLSELGFNLEKPTTIYCDNKAAISQAKGQSFGKKSRHYDLATRVIEDWVGKGLIVLQYVKSEEMKADGLTKSLPPNLFNKFRDWSLGPQNERDWTTANKGNKNTAFLAFTRSSCNECRSRVKKDSSTSAKNKLKKIYKERIHPMILRNHNRLRNLQTTLKEKVLIKTNKDLELVNTAHKSNWSEPILALTASVQDNLVSVQNSQENLQGESNSERQNWKDFSRREIPPVKEQIFDLNSGQCTRNFESCRVNQVQSTCGDSPSYSPTSHYHSDDWESDSGTSQELEIYEFSDCPSPCESEILDQKSKTSESSNQRDFNIYAHSPSYYLEEYKGWQANMSATTSGDDKDEGSSSPTAGIYLSSINSLSTEDEDDYFKAVTYYASIEPIIQGMIKFIESKDSLSREQLEFLVNSLKSVVPFIENEMISQSKMGQRIKKLVQIKLDNKSGKKSTHTFLERVGRLKEDLQQRYLERTTTLTSSLKSPDQSEEYDFSFLDDEDEDSPGSAISSSSSIKSKIKTETVVVKKEKKFQSKSPTSKSPKSSADFGSTDYVVTSVELSDDLDDPIQEETSSKISKALWKSGDKEFTGYSIHDLLNKSQKYPFITGFLTKDNDPAWKIFSNILLKLLQFDYKYKQSGKSGEKTKKTKYFSTLFNRFGAYEPQEGEKFMSVDKNLNVSKAELKELNQVPAEAFQDMILAFKFIRGTILTHMTRVWMASILDPDVYYCSPRDEDEIPDDQVIFPLNQEQILGEIAKIMLIFLFVSMDPKNRNMWAKGKKESFSKVANYMLLLPNIKTLHERFLRFQERVADQNDEFPGAASLVEAEIFYQEPGSKKRSSTLPLKEYLRWFRAVGLLLTPPYQLGQGQRYPHICEIPDHSNKGDYKNILASATPYHCMMKKPMKIDKMWKTNSNPSRAYCKSCFSTSFIGSYFTYERDLFSKSNCQVCQTRCDQINKLYSQQKKNRTYEFKKHLKDSGFPPVEAKKRKSSVFLTAKRSKKSKLGKKKSSSEVTSPHTDSDNETIDQEDEGDENTEG